MEGCQALLIWGCMCVCGVNTGFPEHVGVVLSSYQLIQACSQVPLYLCLPVAAPLGDAEGLAGPWWPPPVGAHPRHGPGPVF